MRIGLTGVACVCGVLGASFVPGVAPVAAQDAPFFFRGDVNQDGFLNVGDVVSALLHQFAPGYVAGCEQTVDFDDNEVIDLSDPVYGLDYLFVEGPPPPPPFGRCGMDPTSGGLTCDETICTGDQSGVVISEILASNNDGIADEDGDRSDWLEIHMLDSALADSIDLGGWYLTDSPTELKWQLPSVTLTKGDYLLVFASGKDRAVAGSELHTNFQLEKNGEYLALVAADGLTVVDEFDPTYPEQLMDVSYGLAQVTTHLVEAGSDVLYHVPTAADAGLGDGWTAPDFTPAGWNAGTSGLGFSGVATEGFEVTMIRASVTVDHITDAENVIANPSLQSQVVTDTASVIDYFNTGGRGNYSRDNAFPGLGFSDIDDFVVLVTGTVVIPGTGSWSFGVNSDDGFSLELTNGSQTFNMSFPQPRGPNDTIQSFNISQAGPYDLRLVFYERGGGAELELFAAQGNRPTFNPSDFRLVGDTDNGGLALAGFAAEIGTDVGDVLRNVNASLWTRFEFDVPDATAFGALILRMKYEDGFVAYLNGQEIESRNAPASRQWNSSASSNRPIEDASVVEEINVTGSLGLIQDGPNVLAVLGLNDSTSNSDFLILPELIAASNTSQFQYMSTPTPGTINVSGATDFVRGVEYDVEHGFFESSFPLTLSTATSGAQIRYTLDGSTPTSTTGQVYGDPLTIDATTVVRAAAFKSNHLDSAVTTSSYFFTSDIIRQSPNGQRPGVGWPSGSVNGQAIDYGMDPDIVNNAPWSGLIEDALLDISTISLVTDLENLFSPSTGIFVNARNDGRAWERRTSVELIHPDGTEGFSTEAGLRIRGAFSRSDGNPKHSFRLIFRNDYGDGKLDYPLFGGEGVDKFDKVDLRTSQNNSWAFQGSSQNTLIRDVFSRDTQRDMLQPYTRSRYYHLYLNGQYWGIFQTEERADEDFAVSYLGGDEDDYDVIKNNSSGGRELHATHGTMAAYRNLYDAAVAGFASNTAYLRVQGLLSDGTPDPARPKLLDPENLMDYMICTYYTGDPDAPVSAWGHISNNVFAIYNHNEPDGFTWYRHDAEHSLGANGGVTEKRLLTDSTDRSIGQQWRDFNPAWLHVRLTQNEEYRLQFADRVVNYFFSGGLHVRDVNQDRWDTRADDLVLAIVAESARWGDAQRSSPRTRNDWQGQNNYMRNTFFPQRTQIVLNDMRSVNAGNMFPALGIVSFSRHGGEVPAGFTVNLSQSNGTSGTIYSTTDGSDPRLWGGAINPSASTSSSVTINETSTLRARVRSGSQWGAMTEARFTVGLEGLVINELMASNHVTLEDPVEPDEFPDWIEIYNGTADTIDLGGMYLTDDLLNLTHWQFAAGTVLDSGQHLIIYADDDGTQGALHTNYQLSKSGEVIALVDVDGETILDSILFDTQLDDVSFGRFPDGSDTWDFHATATPGSANGPHAR